MLEITTMKIKDNENFAHEEINRLKYATLQFSIERKREDSSTFQTIEINRVGKGTTLF